MESVGDYSKELCGGTHTNQTGDIGFIKIIEESSLASGVRRIVAVTGLDAIKYIQNQANILSLLQAQFNCSVNDLPDRVEQMIQKKKELEKESRKSRKAPRINTKSLIEKAEKIGDSLFIRQKVEASSMDELKLLGDSLLSGLDSGIGVLGMIDGEKPAMVIVVTPDLVKKKINAGSLAQSIGSVMGGGGGGKPHLATAGGKDVSKLSKALEESHKIVHKLIKNFS